MPEPVDLAMNYIIEHLDEDLSLIMLADKVYLNPSYFSYLFKVKTGVNVSEFIKNERLSLPPVATITIFAIVGHWNSWFDGIILMNHTGKYPLQSYLQTVIINYDFKSVGSKDLDIVKEISDRTYRAA